MNRDDDSVVKQPIEDRAYGDFISEDPSTLGHGVIRREQQTAMFIAFRDLLIEPYS